MCFLQGGRADINAGLEKHSYKKNLNACKKNVALSLEKLMRKCVDIKYKYWKFHVQLV